MPAKIFPWCVILAAHANARRHQGACGDPISETLSRAHVLAPKERIGAVVPAASAHVSSSSSMTRLDPQHIVVEPVHRGTAYGILLALLRLESRIEPTAPVIFLPADHAVSDEQLMSEALANMAGWIITEPGSVYVFGAMPEGPHDQLGYIVPWLDTSLLPNSVYEFVEMPDIHGARSLIDSGALWNTFIFGGTYASIMQLFTPGYHTQIHAIRRALKDDDAAAATSRPSALGRLFEQLQAVDFCGDILTRRIDRLNVLRLPPCGWWPLKLSESGGRETEVPGAGRMRRGRFSDVHAK